MPKEIDEELVFDHLSVPFFAKRFNFLQNFYFLKFKKKKKLGHSQEIECHFFLTS